jgi:hypothetical protein
VLLVQVYHYDIDTHRFHDPTTSRFRHHNPARLDVPAMRAAAAAMVGTHDFAQFSNLDPAGRLRNPVKTIWVCDVLDLEGGLRLKVRVPIPAGHRQVPAARRPLGTAQQLGGRWWVGRGEGGSMDGSSGMCAVAEAPVQVVAAVLLCSARLMWACASLVSSTFLQHTLSAAQVCEYVCPTRLCDCAALQYACALLMCTTTALHHGDAPLGGRSFKAGRLHELEAGIPL